MCGIAGYFSTQNTFSSEELLAMGQSLFHRGPDADGSFSDNLVGLIHRRLKIIDLSQEANQPMVSTDNRYEIIYNGEVYNYNDLRREHQLQVKTTSDTEVILQLLIQFGIDVCNEFNGMFAIALYDKVEHKLTLIRDRMGVKPLYYFWDGKNFAFASEIKALLRLQYVRQNISLNNTAVNEFLHLGYTGKEGTIYSNIYKLQSGSYIEITPESFTTSYFWNINEKVSKEIITNEYEAKETLRDLVESSVRYRLTCDVPYGTFLSGGIDSSLVTAVAQRNLSSRLQTFTIGFADSKYNESAYAKKVADYLGTEHTELMVTQQDALRLVQSMLDVYDEPFADSSAIPTMLVSQLARTKVTMTLSGDGGDELFMGYGAYIWAKRLQSPMLSTFRKPLSTGMMLGNDWIMRGAKVINYPEKANLPSHIFSQEQGFFSRNELSSILTNNFISPFELHEYPKSLKRQLSAVENQAFFDMNYYLQEDLLAKVDRASMKYSLESRVPLLDYNIVEFALNLDENLKVKNNVQKYLLKQVLYDYVPAELFQRPKWGFSIPLKTWLQNDLKFLIDDYLNPTMIQKHGIFNEKEVSKIVQKFLKFKQEHLYTRVWVMILMQKFMEEKFAKF